MKTTTGHCNRSKSVLLGLLQVLGGRVLHAKLITLTYLVDESNYRFRGETVTGLSYWLDQGVPNAVDNEIARLLEGLVDEGLVTLSIHSTPQDDETYGYEATSRLEPTSLSLSGDDWIEIQTAAHKYRDMTIAQILEESKSTGPMQNVRRQYERLNLQHDPSLVLRREEIADDPLLQEAVDAISSDTGEGITLGKLQESIGQPTSYQ